MRLIRQKLQDHPAGAPTMATALTAGNLLANRQPHTGRYLFGAQKIFMRRMFEAFTLDGHQALITPAFRTVIDGHRQVSMAKKAALIIPAGRDCCRHAFLIETGAGAYIAWCAKVNNEHVDRSIGLRLQDEATL